MADRCFDVVHLNLHWSLYSVAGGFSITNIEAQTVAQAFISACFGVPTTITTDRGSQFESTLWQYLNYTLGANRILTTAYHPCLNGLVERLHRQLKAALKAYPQRHQWTETLPLVLLGIYILLYSKTSSVQLWSWYMVLH